MCCKYCGNIRLKQEKGTNMNRKVLTIVVVALALAAIPALADTVTFDEHPAGNNNIGITNQYSAQGITLNGTNAGTWTGLPTDPGNWGVFGTNGPHFLGFNGPYGDTIHFNSAAHGASFDLSRTNGSSDGTITASAYSGVTLLGTLSVNLGAINTWSTITFNFAGITDIQIVGTGSGFHPFAVDNLNFNETPEPGSIFLFGSGMLTLGGALRKRFLN